MNNSSKYIATLFAVSVKCWWTQLGVPQLKYSDVIIYARSFIFVALALISVPTSVNKLAKLIVPLLYESVVWRTNVQVFLSDNRFHPSQYLTSSIENILLLFFVCSGENGQVESRADFLVVQYNIM